jgi:hypothetical protein
MTFSQRHLQEARAIIDTIDIAPIERMVSILAQVRRSSRCFCALRHWS